VHEIPRVPNAAVRAWFTITPDGSAYAFAYGASQGDLYRVTGLQ
jgi:hypothetical protein